MFESMVECDVEERKNVGAGRTEDFILVPRAVEVVLLSYVQ